MNYLTEEQNLPAHKSQLLSKRQDWNQYFYRPVGGKKRNQIEIVKQNKEKKNSQKLIKIAKNTNLNSHKKTETQQQAQTLKQESTTQ